MVLKEIRENMKNTCLEFDEELTRDGKGLMSNLKNLAELDSKNLEGIWSAKLSAFLVLNKKLTF